MNRREFFSLSVGLVPLKLMGQDFQANVCKGCRYFATEDHDDTPICLKLTHHKQVIDEEVALFQKEMGHIKTDLPLGDNCLGCAPPLSVLLE